MTRPAVISLTEYQPREFAAAAIPPELGEALWRNFGRQVAVEFPSPKTARRWRLTGQGWAGYIPLAPELHLLLQPKAPLANLFGMLEYAYRLDLRTLPGLMQSESLPEFFERLAHVLARRVLDRLRQGLYRAYLPRQERLAVVRGRLDGVQVARAPWSVALPCQFEEHTTDVADNQILLYTLWLLARVVQRADVRRAVLGAVRALHGPVSLRPVSAAECVGRLYHRLNEDYQPLHALCRFFLEQLGPGHRPGERHMLPFLVDMTRLFELFVAAWLGDHLPPPWRVKPQERVSLGPAGEVQFQIDLVLYDAATGRPRAVLDTKYKLADKPSNPDIYQIVAYAKAKQVREALLVYPAPLAQPLDARWDDIRVRSVVFDTGAALAAAGQLFLAQVMFA